MQLGIHDASATQLGYVGGCQIWAPEFAKLDDAGLPKQL